MKRICVVTGSRAEYGLLRWVMDGIKRSKILELQILVTGMHLSPEFGLTYKEIEKDGFEINKKVEMQLSSDTPSGVSKSMGLGMIGFGDAFEGLQPDMVLVLGDRYEIFSGVAAAMNARIPVAHLHGGEATEGAIDESIRHSITKMSHLHFVAMAEYRNRVIQLGEHPDRVFKVGGLGVDGILKVDLMSKDQLAQCLGYTFGDKNLLVTFHPVTLEDNTSKKQINELLTALDQLHDTTFLFTMPNADVHSRVIIKQIEGFVKEHQNSRAFTSLGQHKYLSCLQYFDGVVGNSSSGLLEVPSFRKGTINIGDRQRGRFRAESIIDCKPNRNAIAKGIEALYSKSFQQTLRTVTNPYGDGGASELIVEKLETVQLNGLLKKRFYDIGVQ
jgi:GDP/UDP-N,N'-diacetylbacillosamine 2-epimerase (hydrolysing)